MSYITTYSKIKFNPLNPRDEEILIEDIAHALSLMTRANGHFPEFYSVAQHSIACCEEAIERGLSTKVALACLLHDASEAYMSDVTRPVKRELRRYLEIEERLQNKLYEVLIGSKLNEEEKELVNIIDNSMLYNEFIHYMNEEIDTKDKEIVSSPNFKFVNFKEIEDMFKELYHKLKRDMNI